MPHTKRMFDYIESNIDNFKKLLGEPPKSMLYVGWRHDCKPWWYDYLVPALGIERVGVIEIFQNNFDDLKRQVEIGRYSLTQIRGNIMDAEQLISPGEYDLIFWDHGPEHVTLDDLKKITPVLFSLCGRGLLYCAPWGEWPQGCEDGNAFEEHLSSLRVEDLEELGMGVGCTGFPGQKFEGELVSLMIKD